MSIRPFHDETTLPFPLLGAEHAREFAQTEAAVYVPAEAAQACTELGAETAPEPDLSRFFFLAPYLTRHPWLGPVLIACVLVVWTCIDAYLEQTP